MASAGLLAHITVSKYQDALPLYLVEKQARKLTPEKRFEYRQRHTKPVLDAIRAWLGQVLPQVPPTSATGKALHYLHNAGRWRRPAYR